MFLFISMIIGAAVAWALERFQITQNGYIPSIVLGVGGAMIAAIALWIFGIGVGGRTMTAAVGAAAAVFLGPMLMKR